MNTFIDFTREALCYLEFAELYWLLYIIIHGLMFLDMNQNIVCNRTLETKYTILSIHDLVTKNRKRIFGGL